MKDILNKREGERKKKKTIKRWNYSSPLKFVTDVIVLEVCYIKI